MHNLKVILSLFLAFSSHAQMGKELGIEFRQKLGFLAAHRGVMGHLAEGHAFAGEVSLFQQTKGRKQWHSAFNYPQVGVTLFGGSVGNNRILGTYWGAYSFIEFPFTHSDKFGFSAKIGSGLGYGTKIYDPITNPKNVAMSAHLNALVCFGFKSYYTFGRNKITAGADMTHFSNGASKVPNLGVNLPYLSLGYSRTIQSKLKDTLVMQNQLPFKKWLFGVTLIGSSKESFPTGGKQYPVFAVSTNFRWYSKPKVGVEIAFDVISKQAILNYKKEIQKTQWDIIQMGLYIGYLVPLDNFHLTIGMGTYVKDKYQPEDFLYHRVGMRYYFKNGINTQIILKSHWARADYVEWGIGYTFNYLKK